MPQNITLYKIFLASPSDLNGERAIVRNVVDELNITFAKQNNIKLEVLGWELNVFPSVGNDAQDVINSQINDEFDIFIGLIWSRLGTPTNRDTSGTKEEFERAYQRYIDNKDSVSIMFYFKNSPIPISDIDPEQIIKINNFKSDLKSKGIYWGHFTQNDEFEQNFRINLITLLTSLIKKRTEDSNFSNTSKKKDEISKIDEEFEEIGMYEYQDAAIQYMQEILPILTKLTRYISDLGEKLNKKSIKLDKLQSVSPDVRYREIRKIVDQVGDDMNEFVSRTRIEIPIMSDYFSKLILNYNGVITIFNSFNTNSKDRLEMVESLNKLKLAINNGLSGIGSMRQAVYASPSMTTRFAKAKKETLKTLAELIDEFNSNINMIDELIKNLEEI